MAFPGERRAQLDHRGKSVVDRVGVDPKTGELPGKDAPVHLDIIDDKYAQAGKRRSTAGFSAGRSGSSNQKRLPDPRVLSTPISPPISSISCLQIANPSPVPPKRRVIDVSA
jgi:hypothetical protein